MKCPKCKQDYKVNPVEIEYRYCCDECNIILYPKEDFGKDA
jgi:hypothetical protein